MRPRPLRAFALLSSLLAFELAGCAETVRDRPSVVEAEQNATAASAEYVIGAQDVLAINVWKEQELSLNSVEVRLDGKISVPLIDDIQAAGLTPSSSRTGSPRS